MLGSQKIPDIKKNMIQYWELGKPARSFTPKMQNFPAKLWFVTKSIPFITFPVIEHKNICILGVKNLLPSLLAVGHGTKL